MKARVREGEGAKSIKGAVTSPTSGESKVKPIKGAIGLGKEVGKWKGGKIKGACC